MPVLETEHARAAHTPRTDDQAARARGLAPEKAGDGTPPRGAQRTAEAGSRARREGAGRGAPEKADGGLRGLLRGLRAGDLDTLLLTVAMAADENRMPSADPDEAERILAFLARLAEHGASAGPDRPPDEG